MMAGAAKWAVWEHLGSPAWLEVGPVEPGSGDGDLDAAEIDREHESGRSCWCQPVQEFRAHGVEMLYHRTSGEDSDRFRLLVN